MQNLCNWLIHSDGGLLARLGVGVAIFAWLAVADLRRNGRNARRWREYLFLVSCVGLALVYGIINDQLTVGISWEYFYYGKGLMSQLGPTLPPEEMALRWEAAKVGMKATWTAGLIIGVVLLFANNPSRQLASLPLGRIYRLLPLMIVMPALAAAIMGFMGGHGWLLWADSYFAQMIQDDLWRPYRFMTVFGIHLGGYVGGAIAAIVAAVLIRRERRVRSDAQSQSTRPAIV